MVRSGQIKCDPSPKDTEYASKPPNPPLAAAGRPPAKVLAATPSIPYRFLKLRTGQFLDIESWFQSEQFMIELKITKWETKAYFHAFNERFYLGLGGYPAVEH